MGNGRIIVLEWKQETKRKFRDDENPVEERCHYNLQGGNIYE